MNLEFLSPAWFDRTNQVLVELGGLDLPPEAEAILVDIYVPDGPSGPVEAHLRGGILAAGFADQAPTKLTMPFDLTYAIFVKTDKLAAMKALVTGKVQVDGELSRLMSLAQIGGPSPRIAAFQDQVAAYTAAPITDAAVPATADETMCEY